MKKNKNQIVQIDSKTWIEIPEGEDPNKAKEKFLKRQKEMNTFNLRFGNKGLTIKDNKIYNKNY